jgi:PH (Pleckstrin Homology) domain-containing protein
VNREVFRLAPPLIVWWVWVAFAVANVADFVLQGASARFSVVVSAILLTITGLAYTLALRPRVIAEAAGLTIINPFRDFSVPWPAILAVDTGEWVQVHYAPAETTAARPADPSHPPNGTRPASSAASKAISCWALYLSTRTKRRAARAASRGVPGSPGAAGPGGYARAASRPRPRGILPRGYHSTMSDMLAVSGQEPGYAENSRLPADARYLASLPAAKAIAVRLDSRAARERAGRDPGAPVRPVTARWAWRPAVAVGLPALVLLIVTVAF